MRERPQRTAPSTVGLADRIGARVGTLPQPLEAAVHVPAVGHAHAPAIRGWATARIGSGLMLMPGELYLGGAPTQVRTLLGSCVAITLWHPSRLIGGMCHFMLPQRQRPAHEPADGRYGVEAVDAMVQVIERAGLKTREFVAHLYGGADTLTETSGVKLNIGERNIERGWSLIDAHDFQLEGVDVGDHMPRSVTLTLASGAVTCRRGG